MKKILLVVLVLLFSLGFASCKKEGPKEENPKEETPTIVEKTEYTVYFDSQGGSGTPNQIVQKGDKADKPSDPTRDGYSFDGWYRESGCINRYDFDKDIINGNITIYAKWTKIESKPQLKKATHFTEHTKLEKNISQLEFITIDDTLYIKYSLGKYKNLFIQSLNTPIKNTNGIKMEYSYSELTTTSVTNSITNSISHSHTESTSHSFGVSVGIDIGIKNIASISFGASYNYTKLTSDTIERLSSKTYEEMVSKAKQTSSTYSVDLSEYEKDLYYTFGLYADADMYQVLEYNIKEEKINSYYLAELSNYKIEVSYSKNDFNIPKELKIEGISIIDKQILTSIKDINKISGVLYDNKILSNTIKIHSTNTVVLDFQLNQKIEELKKFDYTKIQIDITMQIAEEDNCQQYITLFSPKGELIYHFYEHGGSARNKTFKEYKINELFDIDDPRLNEILYLKFSAEPYVFKDWYIKDVNIKIKGVRE